MRRVRLPPARPPPARRPTRRRASGSSTRRDLDVMARGQMREPDDVPLSRTTSLCKARRSGDPLARIHQLAQFLPKAKSRPI